MAFFLLTNCLPYAITKEVGNGFKKLNYLICFFFDIMSFFMNRSYHFGLVPGAYDLSILDT
ncbi:MAG: hypothetical protein C5B59_17580 [Bacteroidetes bacterium]|nr:MAG: hypothetical protein C5B59_17580 [Bacteroidota bacterium]